MLRRLQQPSPCVCRALVPPPSAAGMLRRPARLALPRLPRLPRLPAQPLVPRPQVPHAVPSRWGRALSSAGGGGVEEVKRMQADVASLVAMRHWDDAFDAAVQCSRAIRELTGSACPPPPPAAPSHRS